MAKLPKIAEMKITRGRGFQFGFFAIAAILAVGRFRTFSP
jgi:hypothetical protein